MADWRNKVLEQEVLQVLEDTGALLNGHFELRSGLHSDRYFQCAFVLRYPRVAERLCRALAADVRNDLGGAVDADAVISPALGGILVGHEMARALDLPSIFAEKSDGSLVMRRFEIRQGQKFLVAEDVVTRGGRVQETIDIVRAKGGKVVGVAVLVDRSGGGADFGVPLWSLLKMTPVTWTQSECPLCRKGIPSTHPGS
jgi:orotate phosphoribosyltransferase